MRVEDKYKKLTQREHILHRPGMYIGSVQQQNEEMWVFSEEKKKMEKRVIKYTPGLIKIFDEILTNATDHASRDKTLNTIKVEINESEGEISVWNNGSGIPIEKHEEYGIYIPEMLFGELLSGSNYNDNEERTGAGTNGIGANCANIYSKEFNVETLDSERGLKFVQTYKNNMTEKGKAKVTKNSGKSYTKITFKPDLERFNMKELDRDTVDLMKKRVYDCIACTDTQVSIYLNGEKLKGNGLEEYSKYFFDEKVKVIWEDSQKSKYKWEWLVVPNDRFEQISFVNGNNTYLGGKHVDHITNSIVNKLKAMIETKKKVKDVKGSYIKDKLFIFVRATVKNPSFSSQTKEQLTTQVKDFGCKVEVSDEFVNKLYKTEIVDDIIEICKMKEKKELNKGDGKKGVKLYIPKLEDALWAGGSKSDECTLILTEGLSAMTYAIWGRSVVGNGIEKYGVFPLKGKCNSEDTKIPLWNGEIKLAKDINIGDILIGDDGNPRNVLTIYKGSGKMYEISQNRGERYRVNEDHIITVCMPEHKNIFWVASNYTWRAYYWDKTSKNIKAKECMVRTKIECKECGETMYSKSMKRHYERKHKNIKYRPYKLEENNNICIIEARKKLEEFLKEVDDNNVIDISIEDYLNVTESLKRKLKGIRGKCVNWKEKDVLLDPYVLGLWLGDGMKSGYAYSCDKKNDIEIMNYLDEWGRENDAKLKKSSYNKFVYHLSSIEKYREKGEAPLKKILLKYNLINNKHIPKDYLLNSKEVRLKLLAGIIDTDGYVCKDGTIEISQSVKVHQKLADDIVYLSRSLGFYTHIKKKITNYTYVNSEEKAEAYIIKISGDTEQIPTILPRKYSRSVQKYNMRDSTGRIKIKEVEEGKYVGIGIDGNSRFVINDFTVTHNCLNIRDASISQLVNNEEINNLKQIIGLKQGVEYKDTKELRYGKVMILSDSDVDGYHIRGLLVNMFHAWWPELLKKDFLITLRTPIVVVTKGNTRKEFFTENDYRKWEESMETGWKVKYYKGLGTSKKENAQDIFKRMKELKVEYYYGGNECDNMIKLAFEKDKNIKGKESIKLTDQRKKWLESYNKNEYITVNESSVAYSDLINKELIHFSIYDNMRSIPNILDGLKPSQRKIIYYMLEKGSTTNDIKVAQLAGYVSAETNYHHGEASLQQAIVNLAQNFVGSNNLNYLTPEGNFGTRYISGDSASPRYIFTKLSKYTPIIFDKRDKKLLSYIKEDGDEIEPEHYIPIIPTVLLNGVSGIGTGYSTFIPPYKPEDIIDNIRRILSGKKVVEMKPYYRGFTGSVELIEDGKYITKGVYKRISPKKIEITEIPIGTWILGYKEFLESHIEGSKKGEKGKLGIKDVTNKTKDENSILFEVEFKTKEELDELIKNDNIMKEMKLVKQYSMNNMYLFNEKCVPKKYKNIEEIMMEYTKIRLEYYVKRKRYIEEELNKDLDILKNKARFIEEYIKDVIKINKKTEKEIEEQLNKGKYIKVEGTYDYITKMQLNMLSKEKVEELYERIKKKEFEYNKIRKQTEKDLWQEDLDLLEKNL